MWSLTAENAPTQVVVRIMAIVHLPSGLAQLAGGVDALAIDAPRMRELMLALADRFPSLTEHLERMAVAIDGQIYQDALYQKLQPDSEIHFLPPIAGG